MKNPVDQIDTPKNIKDLLKDLDKKEGQVDDKLKKLPEQVKKQLERDLENWDDEYKKIVERVLKETSQSLNKEIKERVDKNNKMKQFRE